ncbi:MAG: TolB family protein [Solirubrobacterales bacterium]
MTAGSSVTRVFLLAALLGVLAFPQAASAAFPGSSGKLAFASPRSGFPTDSNLFTMGVDGSAQTPITALNGDELYPVWSPDGERVAFQQGTGVNPEIWTARADGTDLRRLTNNADADRHPAWSPDGMKIMFASDRSSGTALSDLFMMNADGTGQVAITNTANVDEVHPSWSPDGTRLAFSRDGDIATMNPDGTGLAMLTATEDFEIEPDWSPNGTQLVYRSGINTDDEIWRMNANGSGVTNLTNSGSTVEERPVWSPAGDRIAFTKGAFSMAEVWTMNPDGSGQTRVTTNSFLDFQPSWQPLLQGYARPRAVRRRSTYQLVPAYTACTNPNRTHGPPLAHPSCNPPVQTSPNLFPGTPDINGRTANWNAFLTIKVIAGNPATPEDDAKVKFKTTVKDLYRQSNMTRYNRELRMEVRIRATDKWNTPYPGGGAGPGTGEFTVSWTVPCWRPPDTSVGGSCAIALKDDVLVPGLVKEGVRTIWEFDQIRLYDGGADSDADTLGDNHLLAVQGLFVP